MVFAMRFDRLRPKSHAPSSLTRFHFSQIVQQRAASLITISDDSWKYFAAFDWTASSSGTYRIRVTFFEGVITGTLRVSRK